MSGTIDWNAFAYKYVDNRGEAFEELAFKIYNRMVLDTEKKKTGALAKYFREPIVNPTHLKSLEYSLKLFIDKYSLEVLYLFINSSLPDIAKEENSKTIALRHLEKTAEENNLTIRWMTRTEIEEVLSQSRMADLVTEYFVIDGVCDSKYWRTTNTLYKYMELQHLASTLKNGVYASCLGKSNPFELYGVENPELFRKCSMTNSPKQMLLWTLYGRHHQGCCVEFDVSDVDQILLRKVEYTDSFSSHLDMNPKEICEDLYKVGKEWDFENEYRAVFYRRKYNEEAWNVIGKDIYLKARIKSVTFGLYADDNASLYVECLELLKRNDITVKKCKLRNDKYGLSDDPQFDLDYEIDRIKKRKEREMEAHKNKESRVADVLVMIATSEEEEAIKNSEEWESKRTEDGYEYFITQNGHLTFALARSIGMGGVNAATATQLYMNSINPRFVAMAGFCAGMKNKVNLGDVFVPEKIYEYDTGKQVSETDLLQELNAFYLNPLWIQKISRFGKEWRASIEIEHPIGYEMQMKIFIETMIEHSFNMDIIELRNNKNLPDITSIIEDECNKRHLYMNMGNVIATEEGIGHYKNEYAMRYCRYKEPELKIRTGALATGNRVQQWDGIFEKLGMKYERKTYALDMEGYAVADVAWITQTPFIIAKGVGDFASGSKAFDNRYIGYSSVSAFKFIEAFFNSLEGAELLNR